MNGSLSWEDVEKAIDEGKNVYWCNDCIKIDRLLSSGEYVMIGRAGIKLMENHLKTSDMFIIEG